MLFKFYDEVMELLKTCVPQYVEFATGQNLGLADGEGIDSNEEGEKPSPPKKNTPSSKVDFDESSLNLRADRRSLGSTRWRSLERCHVGVGGHDGNLSSYSKHRCED